MEPRFEITIPIAIDRTGIDLAEIDDLTSSLVRAVKEIPEVATISRVARDDGGSPRTKVAGDIVGWGQILVSLVASGGVVVTFIAAIKDWMLRQTPGTSVKLKIGDDQLEVASADPVLIDRLLADFHRLRS